jgi:hypothetical protein
MMPSTISTVGLTLRVPLVAAATPAAADAAGDADAAGAAVAPGAALRWLLLLFGIALLETPRRDTAVDRGPALLDAPTVPESPALAPEVSAEATPPA